MTSLFGAATAFAQTTETPAAAAAIETNADQPPVTMNVGMIDPTWRQFAADYASDILLGALLLMLLLIAGLSWRRGSIMRRAAARQSEDMNLALLATREAAEATLKGIELLAETTERQARAHLAIVRNGFIPPAVPGGML